MDGVSQSFSRSTNRRTKRQRRSVPTLFVFVAFFIGITPVESARMVRMANRQDGDDDGNNTQRRQKEKGPQFMRNSRPRGSRTQFFSHREFHHEQQQQQHQNQQRRLNPFQIVRPTNKSTPVSVNFIFFYVLLTRTGLHQSTISDHSCPSTYCNQNQAVLPLINEGNYYRYSRHITHGILLMVSLLLYVVLWWGPYWDWSL